MSNDNETVEQVALSDLPLAEQLRIIRGNYSIGSFLFEPKTKENLTNKEK